MTTEIRTFNTSNHIVGLDLDIRVVDQGGEPWFVAKDASEALGMSQQGRQNAMNKMTPDEKCVLEKRTHQTGGLLALFPGRTARVALISESGLYKLIMRSDKREARAFQDWVTKIVLPAIRKDGMYVAGEEQVSTGQMSEDELILKAMEALEGKCKRLTEENEAMSDELNLITIDEYRALSHRYFSRGYASKLGKRASKAAKEMGIHLDKQQRRLIKPNGEPEMVYVNVYPRDIIEATEARLFRHG